MEDILQLIQFSILVHTDIWKRCEKNQINESGMWIFPQGYKNF